MKKVMILVAEEQLATLDGEAHSDGVSRSEWIRRALDAELSARRRTAFERRLEEGYRETAAEDLADARALLALTPRAD